MGQNHDGDIRVFAFDPFGKLKSIHLSHTEHRDHQVYVFSIKVVKSLACGLGLDEYRRIPEIQRNVFIIDLFINPPILLEHKEIIVTANDQHPVDPLLHQ